MMPELPLLRLLPLKALRALRSKRAAGCTFGAAALLVVLCSGQVLARAAGPAIEVGDVSELTAETVGTLNDAEGGLGTAMWEGTPRPRLETLLGRTPLRLRSPAMRDLRRRLLLSQAAIPENGAAVNLAEERLRLLQESGEGEAMMALLSAIPEESRSETMMRRHIDHFLIKGEQDQACNLAQSAIEKSGEAYFREVLIFCQAAKGALDEAQLGIDLLHEQGRNPEPYVEDTLRSLSGKDKTKKLVKQPESYTPLALSLMALAKQPMPLDILTHLPPYLLPMLARYPAAKELKAVEAAELSVLYGMMPAQELQQQYRKAAAIIELSKDPKEKSKEKPRSSTVERARLYLRVADAKDAASRLGALHAYREACRAAKLMPLAEVMTQADMETLGEVKTDAPDKLPFAEDAAAVLLLNGHPEDAKAWLEKTDNASPAYAARAALARIGAEEKASEGEALYVDKQWQGSQMEYLAKTYALLRAMEVSVPAEAWDALLTGVAGESAQEASPAVLALMQEAVEKGRKAEAVSLALLAADGFAPAALSDGTAAAIVGGLYRLGLKEEARRFAMETLADFPR